MKITVVCRCCTLYIRTVKTCSCPFVRYFRTLFWDDITIIWDENIVYFFNWEKTLFWTNTKFVYVIFINKLPWYHPKIMYENIVQKEMNKLFITISICSLRKSSTPLPPCQTSPTWWFKMGNAQTKQLEAPEFLKFIWYFKVDVLVHTLFNESSKLTPCLR